MLGMILVRRIARPMLAAPFVAGGIDAVRNPQTTSAVSSGATRGMARRVPGGQNLDPDAAPLSEHLGGLPDHYGRWPLEDRPAVLWVRREVDCNWKAGMEAFIEGYHVIGTHPQTVSFNGDAGTWTKTG